MFVVFFVHGPYCVFFCLQNRNVPQRMHLQDSVDEMKKFNARRKLKVIYMQPCSQGLSSYRTLGPRDPGNEVDLYIQSSL